MATRPNLRRAVETIAGPWLAEQGFAGDYPEYHRLTGTRYHGIAVEKGKYGRGFFFDLAEEPFSLARHKRLLLSDPDKAVLPKVRAFDLEQRLQVHPGVAPPILPADGDGALPLFPDAQDHTGGANPQHLLEEAVSSCLPRIAHWFLSR